MSRQGHAALAVLKVFTLAGAAVFTGALIVEHMLLQTGLAAPGETVSTQTFLWVSGVLMTLNLFTLGVLWRFSNQASHQHGTLKGTVDERGKATEQRLDHLDHEVRDVRELQGTVERQITDSRHLQNNAFGPKFTDLEVSLGEHGERLAVLGVRAEDNADQIKTIYRELGELRSLIRTTARQRKS